MAVTQPVTALRLYLMNLLSSPTILSGKDYIYDGDGRDFCTPKLRSSERGTMVKSIINGVSTYFAGRHYNLEVNGENSVVQKTYAFGSMTVAVRTEGVLKWVLADHLGSTSITANEDGTLNSEIRYSAFGEVRYSSGTTPTDYQYTNQLNQPDIGLYYYVARFYDPVIAHFVQPDTIVPNPSIPKEYDRFGYALNNPIKFIDPSGHQACWDEHRNDPECNGQVPTANGLVSQTVYYHQTGYTGGNPANITSNAGGGNSKMATSTPTFTLGQGYMQGWVNFDSAVTTLQNSNAGLGNQVGSGLYILGWGGMHAGLAVAGGVLICAMASPACFAVVSGSVVWSNISLNQMAGKAGELASGITKNITRIDSLTRTANYRVPDGLNTITKTLSEVKNVQNLSLSKQLIDFLLYSRANEYTFELWTRSSTQISAPLKYLIQSGEIVQKFIDK